MIIKQMVTKPYLISSASYTPGVDEYLASLKNLSDSIVWVSIEFLPVFQAGNLLDNVSVFVRTVRHEPYPGHLGRLLALAEEIERGTLNMMDPDAWWIFTDTSDVRFQASLPDLEGIEEPIIAVPEGILHNEHSWWTGQIAEHPIFEPLLNEPVHNMGVMAMRGYMFVSFLAFLKMMNESNKLAHNTDQGLYNLFLYKHQPLVTTHPTLMTCLYNNLEKGNVRKEHGLFVNKEGEPYSIVHANGSTKDTWI